MSSLRDLFAADGHLARAVPGYRPRAAQLRMAEAVAELHVLLMALLLADLGVYLVVGVVVHIV